MAGDILDKTAQQPGVTGEGWTSVITHDCYCNLTPVKAFQPWQKCAYILDSH